MTCPPSRLPQSLVKHKEYLVEPHTQIMVGLGAKKKKRLNPRKRG